MSDMARKGLASGPGNPLRRSARWTAARRETCLAVLRATGNARAAGEAIEDGPDRFETIRRGAGGRLQIAAAGKGRWNAGVEARFFVLLGQNGNMSASARAVGFTPETVWERRRAHPGFAKRLAAALEDAEIELEFRLARLGSDIVPAAGGEAGPAEAPPPPFDPEFRENRDSHLFPATEAWRDGGIPKKVTVPIFPIFSAGAGSGS